MRHAVLFFEANAARIDFFLPLLRACTEPSIVHELNEFLGCRARDVSTFGLRINVHDRRIVGVGYCSNMRRSTRNGSWATSSGRPDTHLDMACATHAAMLGSYAIPAGGYSECGLRYWSGEPALDLHSTDGALISWDRLRADAQASLSHGAINEIYPASRWRPHPDVVAAQAILCGQSTDSCIVDALLSVNRPARIDKRYGIHPAQSTRKVRALALP